MAEAVKVVAKNSKAYHDYFIEEKYEKGNIFNKDPLRQRKLLMHKREILRLFAHIKQDGYSLVPLSVYFKGPRVKLEIGLAKGKKLYDKRASAAAKDAKREMDRTMKSRNTRY